MEGGDGALDGVCAGAAPAGRGCCPHCGGGSTVGWGRTRRGWRRWRCRPCRRTFSAVTGTALAGIHDPGKFRRLVRDMAAGPRRSCRALARALDVERMTVWRWRRRVLAALAAGGGVALAGGAGSTVVRLRESRKASRAWVRHERDPARHPPPERPRWWEVDRLGLPLPGGMSRFRVGVLLEIDGRGRRRARRLARGWGFTSACAGHAGTAAPSASAAGNAPSEAPIEALRSAFHAFLRPFRGPAARYLEGYAAWFARLEGGDAATRLAETWAALTQARPHDSATYPSAHPALGPPLACG